LGWCEEKILAWEGYVLFAASDMEEIMAVFSKMNYQFQTSATK
jgi:hypothetical protein